MCRQDNMVFENNNSEYSKSRNKSFFSEYFMNIKVKTSCKEIIWNWSFMEIFNFWHIYLGLKYIEKYNLCILSLSYN